MAMSDTRRALLPAPALPLVYFAGAHVALLLACAVLVLDPALPGAFHYHPRFIAVIHLVTLGWISASILGAFYIVAPLAFGMPFAARALDGGACGLFWVGTAAMVAGFWRADYASVGVASVAVLAAILIVAVRAWHGLATARLPLGVSLHVALAFFNMVVAGSLGLVLALGRGTWLAGWSAMAVAAAHAHLAVLGWAVMMIVGISYRLVPMFLPAAMPTGRGLIWSAVLLETGTIGVAWAIASGHTAAPAALLIVGGLGAFLRQVRGILADRRPRPAEMAGRDWSTWQSHAAMLYVAAATAIGVSLATGVAPSAWQWAYGVAGILGFVAQMIVGIQGRLLPLHAWYRAMVARDGAPPSRSAHRLADGRLTLPIFLSWLAAVPVLTVALMGQRHAWIAAAAALLLASTLLQAFHMVLIARRAMQPL
jgi:hypothetical protein